MIFIRRDTSSSDMSCSILLSKAGFSFLCLHVPGCCTCLGTYIECAFQNAVLRGHPPRGHPIACFGIVWGWPDTPIGGADLTPTAPKCEYMGPAEMQCASGRNVCLRVRSLAALGGPRSRGPAAGSGVDLEQRRLLRLRAPLLRCFL